MKHLLAVSLYAVVTLSVSVELVRADEPVSARTFASRDQKLNQKQAALYIIYRDKEPVSKFIVPGQMTMDTKMVLDAMSDKLDDLRSATGHEAPWTWQELDVAFPPKKTKAEADSALPAWQKIPGITKSKELGKDGENGFMGPFRLRKTSDDFSKKLKDAKGATVGYSNNRLAQGNGAWNTQGALEYPFGLIQQGGPGQSLDVEVGPAVDWNLAQVQGSSKNAIEALSFSLPITAYLSPGGQKMTGTYEENMTAAGNAIYSGLWVLEAKPFFQTDFSWGYQIYGVQASVEYVGGMLGTPIYLGGFQNIGIGGLQYQLRVLPKLDYSVTKDGGIYTSRKKGDDWLRVGGLVSFDLRLGGKTFNPLDLGASYQLLQTLSGSGGYSALFKAHSTWWLSANAGLTLEYSKGETPIADENIDLLTLGLELKY